MTRVYYEWTAKDNKTKNTFTTLEQVKNVVAKFGGTYKACFEEDSQTDRFMKPYQGKEQNND